MTGNVDNDIKYNMNIDDNMNINLFITLHTTCHYLPVYDTRTMSDKRWQLLFLKTN